MKIILGGTTPMAMSATRYLNLSHSVDVVVIDEDAEKIRSLISSVDVQGVVGLPSNPEVLAMAGADSADAMIAATRMDEVNFVACQMARNVYKITDLVAKVQNPVYLSNRWRTGIGFSQYENKSVERLIYPEGHIASMAVDIANAPGSSFNIEVAEGGSRVIGAYVAPGAVAVDAPINRLGNVGETFPVSVMALERDGKRILLDPASHIKAGDVLYVVIPREVVEVFLATLGHQRYDDSNTTVVVGGGPVGQAIAALFSASRPHQAVRVIEQDHKRAVELSEALRDVVVIDGDALDPDIMLESGVKGADIVITATESNEINLIAALSAKKFGARKVAALISDPRLPEQYRGLGVDIFVDPNEIATSQVLPVVRRGAVYGSHIVSRLGVEILEFEAMKTMRIVSAPLGRLKISDDVVIGAILRGGDLLIPGPERIVLPGDRVIVMVASQSVSRAEEFFEVGADFL